MNHHLTYTRVMRPDPTHPTQLEATPDLVWSCACSDEGGVVGPDGIDTLITEHTARKPAPKE